MSIEKVHENSSDSLANDVEFKKRVKEILQRVKVAMDYFRGNIDYALSILQ